MPIYSYRCDHCSTDFDLFQTMAETSPQTKCECGQTAKKVYHAPMAFIETECPAHKAPITGEMITTNAQRREFMARNNLIDANDFTPDYLFKEQKERRQKLNKEAAKAYEDLPSGLTPETVLNEVL